jgi:hypothetical protein
MDQLEQRCADRTPCGEVLDRLHAVDVAVAAGVDPSAPQLQRLRDWAATFAQVHGYGVERES